jgi:hypothetical protein
LGVNVDAGRHLYVFHRGGAFVVRWLCL